MHCMYKLAAVGAVPVQSWGYRLEQKKTFVWCWYCTCSCLLEVAVVCLRCTRVCCMWQCEICLWGSNNASLNDNGWCQAFDILNDRKSEAKARWLLGLVALVDGCHSRID